MKTRNSISALLAALVLMALSAPAPAFSQMKDMSMQGHHGHGQMMEMGSMDKMDDMMGMCADHADKMGLSEDQTAKIKPLHREMQKHQARFTAEQKIAEIDLAEIMEPKDFDLEKAGSAVKKIASLKTAHHLEMLKGMKEMRSILTDAQFKEMKKMMSMKMGEKKPAMKTMRNHKK